MLQPPDKTEMKTPSYQNQPTVKELLKIIEQKDEQIAQLQARVSELESQVKSLLEELQKERRQGKRSATPFSKKKRKRKPRKPGRKPGEGNFQSKAAPEPTEPPVTVSVESVYCACGGKLAHPSTELVTVTELPAMPQPQVTPYHVQVCVCRACGKRVRGEHPDLAPEQSGASAHRYGPRARAAAHVLHYDLGVTVRKVPQVLKVLTGLKMTQSAITQDALKQMKGPVGNVYQNLRQLVRCSDYVYTDDTGWSIQGKPAYLMVFETTSKEPLTVFQIRSQHRNEEVRELIPSDYQGVMTTDRGKSYDAEAFRVVRQNKCVFHIQRNLQSALAFQPPSARAFGKALLKLLEQALELWKAYQANQISLAEYGATATSLKGRLSYQLRERPMRDPDNVRLLYGLGVLDDQGHLLRFLDDPQVEPTNNRSERALRPAVIARKVSQCSKNDAGAEAHAGFMSILQTLKRRGVDAIEGLTAIMQGQPLLSLAPP